MKLQFPGAVVGAAAIAGDGPEARTSERVKELYPGAAAGFECQFADVMAKAAGSLPLLGEDTSASCCGLPESGVFEDLDAGLCADAGLAASGGGPQCAIGVILGAEMLTAEGAGVVPPFGFCDETEWQAARAVKVGELSRLACCRLRAR